MEVSLRVDLPGVAPYEAKTRRLIAPQDLARFATGTVVAVVVRDDR